MTKALMYVLALFGVIGGIDKIMGNRWTLGERFEEGFSLMGKVAFSMIGIYSLSPVLADLLYPTMIYIGKILKIDPSIIISCLLACDMGAYNISLKLAATGKIAAFSGLIIASMMGATVSFTIPIAIGILEKDDQKIFANGTVIGIATIPIGALIGGMVAGIPVRQLLSLVLPLIIISFILCISLLLKPSFTFKTLIIISKIIATLNIIGVLILMIQSLCELTLLKNINPLANCMGVVGKIVFVLSGTYTLVHLINRFFETKIIKLANSFKTNANGILGFIVSLASNIPTFSMFDEIDERGKLMNAAFAVSGAFVFGGQLGFVAAMDKSMVLPFVLAKLSAGIAAVAMIVLTKPYRHICN